MRKGLCERPYWCGIAVLRHDSSLIFLHRIFQEYLAACHLIEAINPASDRTRAHYPFTTLETEVFPAKLVALARSDSKLWWEVVLLARAELEKRSPAMAWQLIDALCPHRRRAQNQRANKDTDWRMAWLAGQVWLETNLIRPTLTASLSHPMGGVKR